MDPRCRGSIALTATALPRPICWLLQPADSAKRVTAREALPSPNTVQTGALAPGAGAVDDIALGAVSELRTAEKRRSI